MLPIEIVIKSYDKERNTCIAETGNGAIIDIDPYVGCAIALSDEDYEKGRGSDVVGKRYILTKYSVYSENVVPHEDGMIEI